MWSPILNSSLALAALSTPPVSPIPSLELKESVLGVVQALEQSEKSAANKETVLPRLQRLNENLRKFELKLRTYTGSTGNTRHWIGTYTDKTTRITALYEDRSDGKGYNGMDLSFKKIRFNFGNGENRERFNITLYGDDNSYLGYTAESTKSSEHSVFGGMHVGGGVSIDAGAISTGDSRLRILHDSKKDQVSATIGKNVLGKSIGSVSWNNDKAWFVAQGGQGSPSSYRATFGDIDHSRSQRAFGFTDGGLNEAFPNAATFRHSIGESPTFNLARRVPGQFLGQAPGATGIDILYTTNTSVDISAGLRLQNSGNFRSPYVGARMLHDLKTKQNLYGFELGAQTGKDTLRARIEYADKTKKVSFGLLFTTTLK